MKKLAINKPRVMNTNLDEFLKPKIKIYVLVPKLH